LLCPPLEVAWLKMATVMIIDVVRRAAEKVSLGSAGWGGGTAARKSSLPETKLLPDAGAVVLG